MIDRIKLKVKNINIEAFSNRIELIDRYTNLSESKGWSKFRYYDIEFTVNENNNLSMTCSFHKFHEHCNYNYYGYNELRHTIAMLEEDFGISSENIEVTSIEFAINIEMAKSAEYYLQHLFSTISEEYTYGIFGDTHYYKNSDFLIVIYDKAKESKLENKNLLRYEVRLKGKEQITKQFHSNSLSDITSESGYCIMLELLHDSYQLIPTKVKDIAIYLSKKDKITFSDVRNALAVVGLFQIGGIKNLIKQIKANAFKFQTRRTDKFKRDLKSDLVVLIKDEDLSIEFNNLFLDTLDLYKIPKHKYV